VRHGETAANTEMRYLGTRDDPLNERGIRQAEQAASALRDLPIAAVYSSPLRRAADTARRIADARGLAVEIEQRLREGAFGQWEGLTRAEVAARDPELLARWEMDAAVAPPGGESLAGVARRVLDLAEMLAGRHAGQSIVLVSHVAPIKALLTAALGAPPLSARRLFLDPGTISVVDWGEPPLVRVFNSHCHLGWLKARWLKRP
jgi:broad specificity phosphatase PhoE